MCCACEYKDASGKQQKLTWAKTELKYTPSFNMGPQDVLPCMVSGSYFQEEKERVLCAMIWGMIPPWHKASKNIRALKIQIRQLFYMSACYLAFFNFLLFREITRNGQINYPLTTVV